MLLVDPPVELFEGERCAALPLRILKAASRGEMLRSRVVVAVVAGSGEWEDVRSMGG